MQPSLPSSSSLFDLSGRIALVTGASGYLGQAMAHGLASAGARVIASSRRIEAAQQTIAALPACNTGEHLAVELDQLDAQSIEAGFAAAVQQGARIDILVNNGHAALAKDWTTTSGDEFNQQLHNLTGYFLLARCLRNHLVEQRRRGSVIMLGSMYGSVASYPEVYAGIGPANPVAYQALKGGILQLTRHLAVYWAPDGVRVNSLSPGPFPSPAAPRALVQRLEQRVPLGRIGQPHELIGPLVFLASEASSYVTGHNLMVDGGWTAW